MMKQRHPLEQSKINSLRQTKIVAQSVKVSGTG